MPDPPEEIVRFDAVRVRTTDLAHATRRYALLLGTEPVRADGERVRFELVRGAVELEPGTPGAQGLRLTVIGGAGDGGAGALAAARERRFGGLDVLVDAPSQPSASAPDRVSGAAATVAGAGAAARAPALEEATPTRGGFLAIDHVVVDTPHPDRAIALWRDTLGVRLALDREFPHRGLRMLFFRSAGVTLELVSPIGAGGASVAGDDLLNGIAYRVVDVAAVRERLLAAGLDVSEVRTGNKQGTRVATVRSETEGVPTLLIEAVRQAETGPRRAWRLLLRA